MQRRHERRVNVGAAHDTDDDNHIDHTDYNDHNDHDDNDHNNDNHIAATGAERRCGRTDRRHHDRSRT